MREKVLTRANVENFVVILMILLLLACASVLKVRAQSRQQLSLADILIALRSKKADIGEKNKILADAVKERGITFTLTPEIEKELGTTGAGTDLISAIRQKAPVLVALADVKAPAEKEKETKPVEDFAFFRTRALGELSSGDLDAALADFGKAVALDPNDAATRHDRALVMARKNDSDGAVAEYTKAAELAPQDVRNYLGRADAYEKIKKPVEALNDYQKVLSLNPADQTAAAAVVRITTALTQAAVNASAKQQKPPEEKKPEPTTAETVVPTLPRSEPAKTETAEVSTEPVDAGNLTTYCTDLVKPIYPSAAMNLRMTGEVRVLVTLDEQGKVVDARAAKATASSPMLRSAAEAAAQRSKFKAVTKNGKPVKATGFMVYNFTL